MYLFMSVNFGLACGTVFCCSIHYGTSMHHSIALTTCRQPTIPTIVTLLMYFISLILYLFLIIHCLLHLIDNSSENTPHESSLQ
jgi:hypothetical protein